MVLGMDVSRLVGPRTGVGRHLEHLLDSWSRSALPFDEVRLYTHAPIEGAPTDSRFRYDVLEADRAGLGWQARRLRPRANETDVFFAAYALPPGVRTRCAVLNVGILEGPFAAPELRARLRSRHFAWSCRRASVIVAISETTKRDVVRWYGVDPGRVHVERPGLGSSFRLAAGDSDSAAVERAFGRAVPYILFVGKLSARRHIAELVRAFRDVAGEFPDLHLLLVGPNTGRIPSSEMAGERVVHVPFLELDELGALYRRAEAFVLPSDREGFGHTVAEAMGSGCPVLLLRGAEIGVLDWARDEPVLRADDARPETLAAALRRLVNDRELRARLAEGGRTYAASFPTWDEHAARVAQHVAEVAATP